MSLMFFNAKLSELFSETINQIARGDEKTLDKLSELHLCVMCKTAMEGTGILRFTEAVCAMYAPRPPLLSIISYPINSLLTTQFALKSKSHSAAHPRSRSVFLYAYVRRYSSPNQLARRTLYWEDCLLEDLYD
jgi:hypothetical protein